MCVDLMDCFLASQYYEILCRWKWAVGFVVFVRDLSMKPGRNPQVDHSRAVKEYSRSSADQVVGVSLISYQQFIVNIAVIAVLLFCRHSVDICQHRSFDNGWQYVSCGQRQPPLSGAPVNKMAVNYHEGETDPSGFRVWSISSSLWDIFVPPYRQCLTGSSWQQQQQAVLCVWCCIECLVFTAQCTLVHMRGLGISCRPSVRPSVRPFATLVDCDHIGWKSWKLIARAISPTPSLFIAKGRSTYSQGNMGKFWGD